MARWWLGAASLEDTQVAPSLRLQSLSHSPSWLSRLVLPTTESIIFCSPSQCGSSFIRAAHCSTSHRHYVVPTPHIPRPGSLCRRSSVGACSHPCSCPRPTTTTRAVGWTLRDLIKDKVNKSRAVMPRGIYNEPSLTCVFGAQCEHPMDPFCRDQSLEPLRMANQSPWAVSVNKCLHSVDVPSPTRPSCERGA